MRLAIAAIVVCLAAVIAGAAAAGIFDAASIPMMVLAFVIVLVLGAAPVVFSAATRRSGAGRNARPHGDAEVHIIPDVASSPSSVSVAAQPRNDAHRPDNR